MTLLVLILIVLAVLLWHIARTLDRIWEMLYDRLREPADVNSDYD